MPSLRVRSIGVCAKVRSSGASDALHEGAVDLHNIDAELAKIPARHVTGAEIADRAVTLNYGSGQPRPSRQAFVLKFNLTLITNHLWRFLVSVGVGSAYEAFEKNGVSAFPERVGVIYFNRALASRPDRQWRGDRQCPRRSRVAVEYRR